MTGSVDDPPPTHPRRHMTITEFRELGYLREINRRMLHPMGLALEVTIRDDGSEFISGVWDERDDPEGILFDEASLVPEMAEQNRAGRREWKQRAKTRRRLFGWMVQPIPKERSP